MNEKLLKSLASWDGVHVEYLKGIYSSDQDYHVLFSTLSEIFVAHPERQKAITWLVKHHYKKGHTIDQEVLSVFYLMSNEVDHWETRLHLLQIMPYIFIPREVYPQVEMFVRKCLEDPKPFVRAWAYQGFYEITQYKPELIFELKGLCERALEEEKASVKARVRKIWEKL